MGCLKLVWKTFIWFIVNNLVLNQTFHYYQDHLERLAKVWQCRLLLLLSNFGVLAVPCVWFWTGTFSWSCLMLLPRTWKQKQIYNIFRINAISMCSVKSDAICFKTNLEFRLEKSDDFWISRILSHPSQNWELDGHFEVLSVSKS